MFFNGINAGATSPDHFHFQGFSHQSPLPVENFPLTEIASNRTVKISELRDYPATVFVAESENREYLAEGVNRVITGLGTPRDDIGLAYNILFSDRAYIFPRDAKKQGSKFYKSKPATIEMCGLLVIREKIAFSRTFSYMRNGEFTFLLIISVSIA